MALYYKTGYNLNDYNSFCGGHELVHKILLLSVQQLFKYLTKKTTNANLRRKVSEALKLLVFILCSHGRLCKFHSHS